MSENKDIAIEVKGLTKKYRLKSATAPSNDFYALDNVSFDVYKGEIIGIIGNNGSGKSTLLSILSQITKPSAGEARFYGEVSSILDIGTNFHLELTGRENVIMHLRLAGRQKVEFSGLESKILAFSEVGDFFDQPVKIYSSGMFLRLAFSVAFHLLSDILVLDEVLSVGDEGFRLKCNEMIRDLAQQGRTILFVSHNRSEIMELSSKCLWLDKGRVRKFDNTMLVLSEYFSMHNDNYDQKKLIIKPEHTAVHHNETNGGIDIKWDKDDAPGTEVLSIQELSVSSADKVGPLYNTDPIEIKFLINKKKAGIQIGAFFFVQDIFYQPVVVGHFLNNTDGKDFSKQSKNETGLFEIKCIIPANFLVPGKYYLFPRFGMEAGEWSTKSEEGFRFSEKLSFTIHPKPGTVDFIGDISKGAVRPAMEWAMTKI